MGRLIDADALMESIRKALGIKGMAKSFLLPAERTIIDQIDSAPAVSGWISVKDRLPENAKHPNAFCPRYLVYTDYGITEGWYNPNKECWYGFLTFMTDEFEVWNIDLERGDIPKRVKNIPVKYWMAMPNPPKEGET